MRDHSQRSASLRAGSASAAPPKGAPPHPPSAATFREVLLCGARRLGANRAAPRPPPPPVLLAVRRSPATISRLAEAPPDTTFSDSPAGWMPGRRHSTAALQRAATGAPQDLAPESPSSHADRSPLRRGNAALSSPLADCCAAAEASCERSVGRSQRRACALPVRPPAPRARSPPSTAGAARERRRTGGGGGTRGGKTRRQAKSNPGHRKNKLTSSSLSQRSDL